MALGQIAPWLQLPNFQAAAEAGARIGLQQRTAAEDAALGRAKLAQEATEAAGRLSLGFTETANAAQKAKAEQDLAKSALALHQGRYSDLNQQAAERHQLGLDRLGALEDNRDVVNDFHDRSLDATVRNRELVNALRQKGLEATIDNRGVVNGIRQAALDETIANHDRVGDFRDRSLDATIDNRADLLDYRNRSLDERTSNNDRAAALKGTPASKPYMVKIPVPADPQTGTPASTVSLPSTHPAAQRYLRSIGMGERPSESQSGLLDTDNQSQSGETLPLPNSVAPITEPGPMPPEELQGPAALPVAKSASKRFKYDPATGKFDALE